MKSRTIRYANPGLIEMVEVDVPDPGPGEIQVQGLACGICAWDLYTFKAGPHCSVPAPPGHEGVGRVIKVGPGVRGLREGTRIVGKGFADYYNMPAERVYVIP